MITLTERAKEYMRSVLLNGDKVSLSVKGGGCSGFQYVWDLKSNLPDITWSDPIEDVLVVDPLAEMYLLGSEIDYVEELGGSFLAVKNPTSTNSCGCGESFGVLLYVRVDPLLYNASPIGNMLFKKTEIQYDIEHVLLEYETLFWHTTSEEWYKSEGGGTQLCIQSYADRRNYVDGYIDSYPYTNGCGSMSRFPDREEQGYNQLNTAFKDTVFQDIVEGHFRARFMTMVMHSTYSVHQDKAPRLHLALDTHPNAYFFWPEHKEFVHIPADGFVYWVDTTKPHTFVNAGPDRTHLVMVE